MLSTCAHQLWVFTVSVFIKGRWTFFLIFFLHTSLNVWICACVTDKSECWNLQSLWKLYKYKQTFTTVVLLISSYSPPLKSELYRKFIFQGSWNGNCAIWSKLMYREKKDKTQCYTGFIPCSVQLQDGPLNTFTKDDRIPILEQKLQYEEDNHSLCLFFPHIWCSHHEQMRAHNQSFIEINGIQMSIFFSYNLLPCTN